MQVQFNVFLSFNAIYLNAMVSFVFFETRWFNGFAAFALLA